MPDEIFRFIDDAETLRTFVHICIIEDNCMHLIRAITWKYFPYFCFRWSTHVKVWESPLENRFSQTRVIDLFSARSDVPPSDWTKFANICLNFFLFLFRETAVKPMPAKSWRIRRKTVVRLRKTRSWTLRFFSVWILCESIRSLSDDSLFGQQLSIFWEISVLTLILKFDIV